MREKNNNLTEVLNIRISKADHDKVMKLFSKTTERKLSGYLRKIILKEPMVKTYRNESLEEIIQVLTRLQSDLNGTANNYNQAVKKLHSYRNFEQVGTWLIVHKYEQEKMLKEIAEIKSFISKTAELWLQS
ncbi:MAG: hypothetical protein WC756_15455 [Taibaiella sp.]|jgi:hypothetical protein